MSPEFLKLCNPSSMRGDLQMIADACGVETAVNIWKNFGGLKLYIPSKPSGEMIREARRQHPELNDSELAEKMGICINTFRKHSQ